MSEEARREMELKWKAAQEAWKVRSVRKCESGQAAVYASEVELTWREARGPWEVRVTLSGGLLAGPGVGVRALGFMRDSTVWRRLMARHGL